MASRRSNRDSRTQSTTGWIGRVQKAIIGLGYARALLIDALEADRYKQPSLAVQLRRQAWEKINTARLGLRGRLR